MRVLKDGLAAALVLWLVTTPVLAQNPVVVGVTARAGKVDGSRDNSDASALMRAKPYIVECYRYDSAADDGARQVERFHLKQVGELPAIAEAKGLVGGADFFKVMDGGRVIHDSRQGG